jgi:hypothetical protein
MKRKRRSSGDRELDRLITKINKTKAPSRNEERRQTARVKSHDVTSDPYLIGITAKAEGKDPLAAIAAYEKRHSAPAKVTNTLAARVKRNLKAKHARENEQALKVETIKAAPIRREIPRPQELTAIMAPPLPKRKKGSKPNIASLIYAFRAFQQYSHAFTRRRLGDPSGREIYYQEMKARFYETMKDAGLADQFDWSDFG